MGRRGSTKYRDYYFLAQYEAGQPELVRLHRYTYEVDQLAMAPKGRDLEVTPPTLPLSDLEVSPPPYP